MIGPSGFRSAYARGLSFQARSSGVPGKVRVMAARDAMHVAKIRKIPIAVRARGEAVGGTADTIRLDEGEEKRPARVPFEAQGKPALPTTRSMKTVWERAIDRKGGAEAPHSI